MSNRGSEMTSQSRRGKGNHSMDWGISGRQLGKFEGGFIIGSYIQSGGS